MVEAVMINWVYVVLLFVLGFITYYRKSLDIFGTAVMIIMGIIIIFSAGTNWLLRIVLFLVMSLVATKYSKKYKMSSQTVLWPVSWRRSEDTICLSSGDS